MKYVIERIGRTVELNDELVDEYQKYDTLRDSLLMIAIRCMYGDNILPEYLSDTALSLLCNGCISYELKTLDMLPKALEYLEKNGRMVLCRNINCSKERDDI